MTAGGGGNIYLAILQLGLQAWSTQNDARNARRSARAAKALAYRIWQQTQLQRSIQNQALAAQRDAQLIAQQYAPTFAAPSFYTFEATPIGVQAAPPTNWRAARPLGLYDTKKEFRRARRDYVPPSPQSVSVATYGVNRPLVRGSREDPAGMQIPPRFLWADSLRT